MIKKDILNLIENAELECEQNPLLNNSVKNVKDWLESPYCPLVDDNDGLVEELTKDQYLNIQRAVLELEEFKENTYKEFDVKGEDKECLSYCLINAKEHFKDIFVMSYYYGFSDNDRTFYKWNGQKLIEATDDEDEILREFDNETPFFEQEWTYHLLIIDNNGTELGDIKEVLK